MRRYSKGIRHAVEEREHRRDIDSFGHLRFGPPMIAQLLHIGWRGAVGRLRHFRHVVEQRPFRVAESSVVQLAFGDCLYRLLFCSLNPQEVSV